MMADARTPLLMVKKKKNQYESYHRLFVYWIGLLVAIAVLTSLSAKVHRDEEHNETRRLERFDLNAQCNDGSPATYYYSAGSTNTYVLYLQGGGWCPDFENCKDPKSSSDDKAWLTFRKGHLFNSQHGPLADASIIWASYCSMDAWAGNYSRFQGAKILDEIVDAFPLAQADLLVFAGGSAGGRGVIYNLERLLPKFPENVVALVDSAVWFDSEVARQDAREFIRFDPVGCSDESCLITSNTLDRIQVPLVIFQFLYDSESILRGNRYQDYKVTPDFIRQYRRNATRYLANLSQQRQEPTLVFAPACYGHMLLTIPRLDHFSINHTDFETAFDDFVRNRTSETYLDTCTGKLNCGYACDPPFLAEDPPYSSWNI